MFVKISQVSANEGMGKLSTCRVFNPKTFQIHACLICLQKAKHLGVTAMFTRVVS